MAIDINNNDVFNSPTINDVQLQTAITEMEMATVQLGRDLEKHTPDQIQALMNGLKNGASMQELKESTGMTARQINVIINDVNQVKEAQAKSGQSFNALVLSGASTQQILQDFFVGNKQSLQALQQLGASTIDIFLDHFEGKLFLNNLGIDGPIPPPSLGQIITPPPDPNINVNAPTNNPWFAISYLAVLQLVMMELLKIQQKQAYTENQFEIVMNIASKSIAQSVAAMTLESFEKQAWEKRMDAISSFLNAAVSACSLIATTVNFKTTQKQVNDKHAETIKRQEQKLNDFDENKPTLAGSDPKKVESAKKLQTQQRGELEENLDTAKATRDRELWQKTEHFNTRMNLVADIFKGSINGSVAIVQSILKEEQGVAEAAKVILENQLQLIKTLADKASKQGDQANQDFNQVLELLKKIIDSLFQAFSPRA